MRACGRFSPPTRTSASATSREHDIRRGADGLISVVGGKLTTLRRMGEQAVDAAVESLRASGFEGRSRPAPQGERPLPGGGAAVAPGTNAFRPTSRSTSPSPTVRGRLESPLSSMSGRSSAAGSPRTFPTSGLRSFWRCATSTRARSPTSSVVECRCSRDGLDQGLGAAEHAADSDRARARVGNRPPSPFARRLPLHGGKPGTLARRSGHQLTPASVTDFS